VGLYEHRNVLGPKCSWEFLVQLSSDCWLLKKTPVPCTRSSSEAHAHPHTHTHPSTAFDVTCFGFHFHVLPRQRFQI